MNPSAPESPEATRPAEFTTAEPEGAEQCAHCGAPLQHDQEWCLECGAARTLIHGTPNWRVPVAIIAIVVVLVLAAFAIALASLSSDSSQDATTTSTAQSGSRLGQSGSRLGQSGSRLGQSGSSTGQSGSSTASAPPTITSPVATDVSIGTWPAGLPGWTVLLASTQSESDARVIATELAAGGTSVGILNSSDHPVMTPGHWIVFAGRYPTESAAKSAARRLKQQGNSSARVELVARPGQ